jgi:hypothetical protein
MVPAWTETCRSDRRNFNFLIFLWFYDCLHHCGKIKSALILLMHGTNMKFSQCSWCLGQELDRILLERRAVFGVTLLVLIYSSSSREGIIQEREIFCTMGVGKQFGLTLFAEIWLSLGWIPNSCWLNIFPSYLILRCHLLETFPMTSLRHSLGMLQYHPRTATCALSLPLFKPRTQLNTLPHAGTFCPQTEDNQRWLSDGVTPSLHKNDVVHLCPWNRLPFCDSCPCTSTSELGHDAAVFHRCAQLGPFVELWLDCPMIIRAILQLVNRRNSGPCPRPFRMPFIVCSGAKRSTWLCLEIRTQDEVTVWRLIIVPLKGGGVQIFGNNVNK